ncbi:hypothetical protein ACFLX3_05315 [Chloroflexota bacterium]
MKKWLSLLKLGESGQAMLAVLALMAVGGVLVIPTLNFASTSVKTTNMFEKNLDGLYAADAGVEDALWIIKNDTPTSFPYSYQLTNLNGMIVDVVIDEVTTIAGEDMGESGIHEDYMGIIKLVTYDAGIYDYSMTISNNGTGNMKIEKILIDFPPNLEYVTGSTGGDLTTDEPNVTGNSATGITLVWLQSPPYPSIPEGSDKYLTFQLSGPPDVNGVEGHGVIQATRDDVGTVWDSTSYPYSIVSQAKDSTDTVVATIRAGVWAGSGLLDISCWKVNP